MGKQAIRGASSGQPLPPLDVLREHVAIDEAAPSGLRWARRAQGPRLDGRVGSKDANGYWNCKINNRALLVHRVVWALVHGCDPVGRVVDHIDGNASNNAVSNLRIATHAENLANSGAQRGRASLYKGVARAMPARAYDRPLLWRGVVVLGCTYRYLGLFGTEREAAQRYNAEALAIGGPYARLNLLDAPGETVSAVDVTTDEMRARVGLPLAGAGEGAA